MPRNSTVFVKAELLSSMVRSARCHTALTAPCNFSDLLACVGVLFFKCAQVLCLLGSLPMQPTHAAYIVSSSFSFSLLTLWDRLGVRGKMVGANAVGRTVFLDLGSGVNVEFAKRHGLLSMRSCAMGCCGKMIALASCHRLTRVCGQQAKHERLHQGIHTMFLICIFLLASRALVDLQPRQRRLRWPLPSEG